MAEIEYRFAIRPLSEEAGGGYLIEYPDLLGCVSDGETIEEAIANGRDVRVAWIAAMREAGRPVPPPGAGVPIAHPEVVASEPRQPRSSEGREPQHAIGDDTGAQIGRAGRKAPVTDERHGPRAILGPLTLVPRWIARGGMATLQGGVATNASEKKAGALIAGRQAAPDWLVNALVDCRDYLHAVIAGEEDYPKRAELTSQFEMLAAAAGATQKLLVGIGVWDALTRDPERSAAHTAALKALPIIAAAAQKEAEAVPAGGGAGKLYVFELGLSSHTICAGIVAVGWRMVRDTQVPHTAPTAHKACELLWLAAGADSKSWSDTHSGWLAHLKAAKAALAEGRLGVIESRFLAARARTAESFGPTPSVDTSDKQPPG